MVHELIVLKSGVLSQTVHRYSKLPLTAPTLFLFLSFPPWGSSVLAWSNHPQQERIHLQIVHFTLGIAPPTAARDISEADN